MCSEYGVSFEIEHVKIPIVDIRKMLKNVFHTRMRKIKCGRIKKKNKRIESFNINNITMGNLFIFTDDQKKDTILNNLIALVKSERK